MAEEMHTVCPMTTHANDIVNPGDEENHTRKKSALPNLALGGVYAVAAVSAVAFGSHCPWLASLMAIEALAIHSFRKLP
jgi:hypothetical protein